MQCWPLKKFIYLIRVHLTWNTLNGPCYIIIIIIIIIISIEFLTSQLWLGNIHLSWDVVINRIRFGGLICGFKTFLTIEHVPRIADICNCIYIYIYIFECKLSLVRLCDSDFGIIPADGITIGITCAAFCFHMAHISFASTFIVIIIIIIIIIITEETEMFTARRASRQCPLVLLVKVETR